MNQPRPMPFAYFHLHRAFFECMRSQMKDTVIRPQQVPLLMMLSGHEGISQADIMRKLDVSAATVAVSIARLEKLGLVCRTKNPSNHRAYQVSLTDQGRDQVQKHQQVMQEVSTAALAGFSEEDLQNMNRYVTLALKNLENLQKGRSNDA